MNNSQNVMEKKSDSLLKSLLFDNEAAARRVNNSRSEREAKNQRIETKIKTVDSFKNELNNKIK